MLARADLASLLDKLVGELGPAPDIPDLPGPSMTALMDDTQEILAHAEALLAATRKRLNGLRLVARQATGRYRERGSARRAARQAAARRRLRGSEPTVPIETLRDHYVDQRMSSQQIGTTYGMTSQEVEDHLVVAGIHLRGRGEDGTQPPAASPGATSDAAHNGAF